MLRIKLLISYKLSLNYTHFILQIYESEEFYALTDKYGILIWHDFMFACSMYPTDATYLENVKDETVHQVFARSSEVVVCKAVLCCIVVSATAFCRLTRLS